MITPSFFDVSKHTLACDYITKEAKALDMVLKVLTHKFKLHEGTFLISVFNSKEMPPNFTGADMYALCAVAWFHAAKYQVLAVDADPTNMKDEVDSVVVEYEDFVTVSSLTNLSAIKTNSISNIASILCI
ncbi:hypothetical protein R6Q59_024689 [Mikania micrantha]